MILPPKAEKQISVELLQDPEDWHLLKLENGFKKEIGEDKAKNHPARFALISKKWDDILNILKEELPTSEQLLWILNTIGISHDPKTIGIDDAVLRKTFRASKDIRDKYVLSRLAWDLGVLDELCDTM